MAVLSTQLQSGGWSAGINVYQIQSEANKPRLILIHNDRVEWLTWLQRRLRVLQKFISVLGLHHKSHNCCEECVELRLSVITLISKMPNNA